MAKEKLIDYEGTQYLNEAGKFEFEITSYELQPGSSGSPVAKFELKCDKGVTTVYHSLNPKARWSQNNLIKCALHINTPEKLAAFELDYETIGNDLIGKKVIGIVERETYLKDVSTPTEDGTFVRETIEKESFKIKSYEECK